MPNIREQKSMLEKKEVKVRREQIRFSYKELHKNIPTRFTKAECQNHSSLLSR